MTLNSQWDNRRWNP